MADPTHLNDILHDGLQFLDFGNLDDVLNHALDLDLHDLVLQKPF